jgi:hypothetical protein
MDGVDHTIDKIFGDFILFCVSEYNFYIRKIRRDRVTKTDKRESWLIDEEFARIIPSGNIPEQVRCGS